MPQDLIKAARLLAGRKLETEKSWVISDRQALKLTMELDFQPVCGWVRAVALLQSLAPNLPTATHMQIPESVVELSDTELGFDILNAFHDTLAPPNAMVALTLALSLNPLWVLILTAELQGKPKTFKPHAAAHGARIATVVQELIRDFECMLEEALTYDEVQEGFARLIREHHESLTALNEEGEELGLNVIGGPPLASYFKEALDTLLSDVYVPLGYTVEGMPEFYAPTN